MRRLLDYSN